MEVGHRHLLIRSQCPRTVRRYAATPSRLPRLLLYTASLQLSTQPTIFCLRRALFRGSSGSPLTWKAASWLHRVVEQHMTCLVAQMQTECARICPRTMLRYCLDTWTRHTSSSNSQGSRVPPGFMMWSMLPISWSIVRTVDQ